MRKLSVLVAALLMLTASSAFPRDGVYQNRPSVCASGVRLEKCRTWVGTVRRPDYRAASCCGEGDAFIADDFELGANGELYAIISADYPDLQYPGADVDDNQIPPAFTVHRGQKILIPPEKRNNAPEDANQSGHGVVFLMPSNGAVLCYFAPPLI